MTRAPGDSSLRGFGVRRIADGREEAVEDLLAVESPLEIRVEAPASDGSIERRSIVALRTPGHDEELAAGLLFAEGVLHSREEIDWIEREHDSGGDVVVARLRSDASRLPEDRVTFISASCGACGKSTLATLQSRRRHPIPAGSPELEAAVVHRLPDALRAAQSAFDRSGGVHAAGLFDLDGTLRSLREDIGRHNALDKLVGRALLDGEIPLANRLVLVSGRAGFELVQKAAMAAVPVLASVGAPSSLAVEIARGCGMTLLGFVREHRFNIYADCGRMARPSRSIEGSRERATEAASR
jgi:FdhD protein